MLKKFDIKTLLNNNIRIKELYKRFSLDILSKMKTESDARLFVSNFYIFCNYDSYKDFVICLDDIYEWCGYDLEMSTVVLTEKFTQDVDYKIIDSKYFLNFNTFRKFCMILNTSQGDKVIEYYMNLEKVLVDLLKERLEKKERKRFRLSFWKRDI